ncbi:hypothetical protein V6N13_043770 [Hibiscus sabdariffa]
MLQFGQAQQATGTLAEAPSILNPTQQSTSTSNVHILTYGMNLGQPGQAQQSTATSNVHILPHAMNVAFPGLVQLSSSSTSNVRIFLNVMSIIHTHQHC